MRIYVDILERLQNEYANGATYQEIAERHNVSNQYIHGLLNGKNPPHRISLEYLFKMFPNAKISIDGNVPVTNHGVNNGVQGINNGTVKAASSCNCRSQMMDAVIDLDIDDTARTKVLKLIKALDNSGR